MLVAILQNSWPEETMRSNKWQPLFKSLSFGVCHYTELGDWNYRHCVCLIFCIDIWLLLSLSFLTFVSCRGTCLPMNINFLFVLLSSTLLEHRETPYDLSYMWNMKPEAEEKQKIKLIDTQIRSAVARDKMVDGRNGWRGINSLKIKIY